MFKNRQCLTGYAAYFLFVLMAIGTGFNFAQADWLEPMASPPASNIAKPLNEATLFGGDIAGVYNQLKINVSCSATSSNQALIWNGSSWVCGDKIGGQNLLEVLNTGADASGFTGDVLVGGNFYAEGEIKSKWLHATADGNNSIMGRLGIGTNNPRESLEINNSFGSTTRLKIADPVNNPELQFSYGSGGNLAHWAIYTDKGNNNSLNFWNNNNILSLLTNGNVGIGTISPAHNLHIKSDSGNAELDIQSGSNSYWALYHDQTTDEIRFWKDDGDGNTSNDNQVSITKQGRVTADDFCLESGQCLRNGGGGLYVGMTPDKYNGNQTGYKNINKICSDTVRPGSHACTTNEILTSIRANIIPERGSRLWILNGPPGFKASANDCSGRTTGIDGLPTTPNYGTIWIVDDTHPDGQGAVVGCSGLYKIACCKF